jgi:hypothetical protein
MDATRPHIRAERSLPSTSGNWYFNSVFKCPLRVDRLLASVQQRRHSYLLHLWLGLMAGFENDLDLFLRLQFAVPLEPSGSCRR